MIPRTDRATTKDVTRPTPVAGLPEH